MRKSEIIPNPRNHYAAQAWPSQQTADPETSVPLVAPVSLMAQTRVLVIVYKRETYRAGVAGSGGGDGGRAEAAGSGIVNSEDSAKTSSLRGPTDSAFPRWA